MPLTPGTRLGPYEITAQIGQGGMGEVYRATDTKLDRDVAIKVLPESVATDPERLARFDREARTLAALNHPNIAAIHGLEDSDGTKALVMELVEGPTLADRIAQGPIPVDEALPIAKQIAEALEAAHEQGIIHRDLKPANIKLRPDGTVKVLDFGLAKAMEPTGAMSPSMSQSPTITTPAMTQAGMILGTAAYMSPEQARGKQVDKRADIWAFGCVLYEMLTGRLPFAGDTVTEILAEVMKSPPAWSALPASLPTAVRHLRERCLEKEPRQRLSDIGEARLDLERPVLSSPDATMTPPTSAARSQRLPWAVAGVLAVALGGLVVWLLARPTPVSESAVVRLEVALPPEAPLGDHGGFDLAVSPDGRRIAYLATDAATETQAVYERDLGAPDGRKLEGTEAPFAVGNINPFFSLDGQWLVYRSPGVGVMRISAQGGTPLKIADDPPAYTGGAWASDDTVIYSAGTELLRVSADGDGTPQQISPTAEPDALYVAPVLLPGEQAVLFNVLGGEDPDAERIALLDLRTGEMRVLLDGGVPKYAASGHLLFVQGTTLMAAPFDVDALALTGRAAAVQEGVRHPNLVSAVDFGVADNGTLVYVPSLEAQQRAAARLVWVNRDGQPVETVTPDPLAWPRHVRLSPDGQYVAAVTGFTSEQEIWVYSVDGAPPLRLTEGGYHGFPVWSADGQRLAFLFNGLSTNLGEIAMLPADGSVLEPQRLVDAPLSFSNEIPTDWAATGELLFSSSGGNSDLFTAQVNDGAEIQPLW